MTTDTTLWMPSTCHKWCQARHLTYSDSFESPQQPSQVWSALSHFTDQKANHTQVFFTPKPVILKNQQGISAPSQSTQSVSKVHSSVILFLVTGNLDIKYQILTISQWSHQVCFFTCLIGLQNAAIKFASNSIILIFVSLNLTKNYKYRKRMLLNSLISFSLKKTYCFCS